MNSALPASCKLRFDDPDKLYDFYVTITPDEGYWKNGSFLFHVQVTEEYNFAVSWRMSNLIKSDRAELI